MVFAGIIQIMIYNDPAFLSQNDDPNNVGVPSNLSVFWQIIPYFLIAISEIFASIASRKATFQLIFS